MSPLSVLIELRNLDLHHNRIAYIQPLVDNPGIGTGDIIDLTDNPLNSKSLKVHIPALINRGVEVKFPGLPPPTITPVPSEPEHTTSNTQVTTTVADIVSTAKVKGERWGLLIGIEDYEDARITDLRYSIDDVQRIAEILRDPNRGAFQHFRMLTSDATNSEAQPTRINIMRALNNWLSQAKPEDTVLFFFSGHGTTDDKEHNYLIPVDVQVDLFEDTALRMERINEILDDRTRISAEKVIVILDSCHSGAKVGQKAFAVEGRILDSLFTDAEGRITFASCSRSESSFEDEELGHGVFSYYISEGLKGASDKNRDGYILANELFTYVADNVRLWAKHHGYKQTPREQRNVTGSILIGYQPKNLAKRQRESAQETFDAYRRKLRAILDLDVTELAKAEKLLEREMKGEPMTKVEKEWLGLIRDLADGQVSVRVYLLAKRGLGIKSELPKTAQ